MRDPIRAMRNGLLMQRWAVRVKLPADPNGCWEWLGCKVLGYARISYKRAAIQAHRYGYMRFIGPIPDGLMLDHLCRNRGCVNPAHLEPVTCRENIMRSPITHGGKTHCVRGHLYDGTRVTKCGKTRRTCSTCKDLTTAAWRAKNPEKWKEITLRAGRAYWARKRAAVNVGIARIESADTMKGEGV